MYLNLIKPLYLSNKPKNVGHRGTSWGLNHQNPAYEKCYRTDDPVSSTNQIRGYLNTSIKPTASILPPWNLPVSYSMALVLWYFDHCTVSYVSLPLQDEHSGVWQRSLAQGSEARQPELKSQLHPSVNSSIKWRKDHLLCKEIVRIQVTKYT